MSHHAKRLLPMILWFVIHQVSSNVGFSNKVLLGSGILVSSLHGVGSVVTHTFIPCPYSLARFDILSLTVPLQTHRISTHSPSTAGVFLSIVCLVSLFKFFFFHWQLTLFWMGKDQPVFDASSSDRSCGFNCFVVNFRDFCIMEDYINPAKPLDSENYRVSPSRVRANNYYHWHLNTTKG